MPLEVLANVASTAVSTGGTTAPAAGTVESWSVVSPAPFPAVHQNATLFHVADPVLPGEIIAVTKVSGASWTVTRGAESTTPVAHTPGFTAALVVPASALAAMQYKEFQFPVAAYGAVGDGKLSVGGTGTSGSATFTDSTASFVNAAAPLGDVGKVIIINQGTGQSTTNPFLGTITAVNSATSVTLNTTLGSNAANAPYIFGTDDAAAITAAVNAAAAYAEANNQKAQVVFGPRNYMLSALTQVAGTSSVVGYNAHIPVPTVAGTAGQYGRTLVIEFTGHAGWAGPSQYWESEFPFLAGTCLISAIKPASQPDATYGTQAIIGGPTGTGALSPGNFANTTLVLDGLTLVQPWNSTQYGVFADNVKQLHCPDFRFTTFCPVNLNNQPTGTPVGGPYLYDLNIVANGNAQGVALSYPRALNNANCTGGIVTIAGANVGVQFAEHIRLDYLITVFCNIAAQMPNLSNASHGGTIGHWTCEDCNYALYAYNSAGGALFPIDIQLLDMENILTGHVNDPNNMFYGRINYMCPSSTHPVLTGGSNLAVYDLGHNNRGHVAAPAVPLTTVALQNPFWRDAAVYITSGGAAVTAIAVNGTATGLTLGTSGTVSVRVPTGATITLTYASTAPTWVWNLD